MNLDGSVESGAHHDDAVYTAGLHEQGERVENLRARPSRREVFLDQAPVFPVRHRRLAFELEGERGGTGTHHALYAIMLVARTFVASDRNPAANA